MNEFWKDVVGYEGFYKISSLGRVKSVERIANNNHLIKEKILKPNISASGYLRVALKKNNSSKMKLIHRLVAQAFIPNPQNKPQIDHINTIRDDNRVINLRWVTASENRNNPITLKRCKIVNTGKLNPMYGIIGAANSRSRAVLQFSKDGVFIKEWLCINDIKRELGINVSNIPECCKGKHKHTKGYIWRYKENQV